MFPFHTVKIRKKKKTYTPLIDAFNLFYFPVLYHFFLFVSSEKKNIQLIVYEKGKVLSVTLLFFRVCRERETEITAEKIL